MFQPLSRISLRSWVLVGLAGLLFCVPGEVLRFAEQPVLAQVQPQRAPAPGLDGGVAWLNHDKELTSEDLRGRIVLLDFWTLC